MSFISKYGRKLSKWFKEKVLPGLKEDASGAVEKGLEVALSSIQDELSQILEEKAGLSPKMTAEWFWKAVDKFDDALPFELDDQTPGK